jgi:uroporphyrinogen III methyltransferase/synthase
MSLKTGKVYLVGAGPGDPGLITCKGRACLEAADVVVYDHLAEEGLLENAPAPAERIYVGKSAGRHTLPQEEINRLLVARAREGKTVVRLKGGDPFVLGRGGEEAVVLAENGIAYEVVPGITSAIAVPAYTVITGHEDPAKSASSLNWTKLAGGADTLVILMGMENIGAICRELIGHGRPAATPVAVIKYGTRPGQQTVTSTLADIARKAAEAGLSPPATIVVGEVVGLRETINWFEGRPLFGKRILVTRARQQASRLSRLLAERGSEPVELPAIRIEPARDDAGLRRAVAGLDRYQWVVFTSVNGVAVFFRALQQAGKDSRALHGISVGAIGPATAAALGEKGIVPEFVPDVYTTEGIVEGLKQFDIFGRRFLLPRTDIADETLGRAIEELGGEVEEVTAYRTSPATESLKKTRELLDSKQIDVITFTSSSTVTNLMAALGKESAIADGVIIASIGPKTTATAVRAGLKVHISAAEPTVPALVEAIEEYFQKEGTW